MASLLLAGGAVSRAGVRDVSHEFMQECREAAAGTGETAVVGKDGWLFLRRELRHVGAGKFWGEASSSASRAVQPDLRDPLEAIVDFSSQLSRMGIELIVMPVPAKAFVYPEMISGAVLSTEGRAGSRLDVYHQEFYRLLRDKGIKVIDLMPAMAAHRRDGDGEVFCRTDTHWSGQACVLAARLVADELADRPWMRRVRRRDFDSEQGSVTFRGDLLRAMEQDTQAEPESLSLRFVGTRTGGVITPVEPDPDSPVLLLADSHGLVFHAGGDMYTRGAGLLDQLALEMGFAADLSAVRGSGARSARITLQRRSHRDPGYLKSKKAVVWCFSAREFTESPWGTIPLGQ